MRPRPLQLSAGVRQTIQHGGLRMIEVTNPEAAREANWGRVVIAVLAHIGFIGLLALVDIRSPERDDWILPAVVGSAFVLTAIILALVGPNVAAVRVALLRVVAQVVLAIVTMLLVLIGSYVVLVLFYVATGHFEP